MATIEVARKTDRVYAVTFRAPGEDPDRYEAHASSVKGAPLLNVRELDKANTPWVFARYSFLRPGVLEVQLVSDTLLKGGGVGGRLARGPGATSHRPRLVLRLLRLPSREAPDGGGQAMRTFY